MKVPQGLKMVAVTVAVAFVSSVTGYLFGASADNKAEPENVNVPEVVNTQSAGDSVEVSEESISVAEKEIPTKYVLKKDGEGISLFIVGADGKGNIYKTYDVNVATLPEIDRKKLKDGIAAESLSEALLMVEDYL